MNRSYIEDAVIAALLLLVNVHAAAPPAEHYPGHTDEEVQEAREEFESIDTNKDGFITRFVLTWCTPTEH